MKLAFISDVHENPETLKTAILKIEKLYCDEIVCLGDITGFSKRFYNLTTAPDANECVRIIKQNCKYTIAGNHDLHSIGKLSEYHKIKKLPENWYDLPLRERIKIDPAIWHYSDELVPKLDENSKEFLNSLPEKIFVQIDQVNYLFTHFIFPDITGSTNYFPQKSKDFERHFNFMNEENFLFSFAGHGHIPGFFLVHENKTRNYDFGTKKLDFKKQIIIQPSISAPIRGFCTYDTKTREFSAIKIS